MKKWILTALLLALSCGGEIDKKIGNNANNRNNANNVNNVNNVNNANNLNNLNNLNNTNNTVACIEVDPAVDFGGVVLGTFGEQQLSISNCGTEEIQLSFLFGDNAFEAPDSVTVPADSTGSIDLIFTPDTVGEVATTMNISVGGEVVETISVQGEGLDAGPTCPIARATAAAGGAPSDALVVDAFTAVTLDGTTSIAVQGQIDEYLWTVVAAPLGANETIVQATKALAEFTPDVPGVYELELNVVDSFGEPNCDPATITITALEPASDSILFQVTWDTPGDANQNDLSGSDIDMHILNKSQVTAMWNQSPFDCYWNNANPEWGPIGDAGNCSLDRDDSDGLGPENYNIEMPEDILYGVGVHYFTDRAFGPSTATVRIFRNGVMISQRSQTLTTTGQFWYVGDYDASNDTLNIVDVVTADFP